MKRLFVFGHSAGAAHTASYAYGAPGSEGGLRPAGSIVISGRVRADNLPTNPNARKVEAYYGTDNALFEERSAVHWAGKDSVPTFIAIAEFENPMLDVYCLELAHKLGLAKGNRRASGSPGATTTARSSRTSIPRRTSLAMRWWSS